jgi:amino acid adenylation domain-containing protein/thioester reductase-like protein
MEILSELLTNPESTIYNIPHYFKLSSNIEPEKLSKAIDKALSAHPYIFVTFFADHDGYWKAKRNDESKPVIEIRQADAFPDVTSLIKPFPIDGDRFYRIYIYKTKDNTYLFMDFCHILFDGFSSVALIDDISRAYQGQETVQEEKSFFDIALDEKKERATDKLKEDKRYFGELLSDSGNVSVPMGDIQKDGMASRTYNVISELNPDEVKKFCLDNHLNRSAFFNAAFAYILSEYTNDEKILFTTVNNGRSGPEMLRTLGMFVKTIPIACNITGDENVVSFVSSVKEQLKNSLAHGLISFAEIAESYEVSDEVMFSMQGEIASIENFGGEKIEEFTVLDDEAQRPLSFDVYYLGSRITYKLEYNGNRYSDEYISMFALTFDKVCNEFLRKEKLRDISLCTEKTESFLEGFNDTDIEIELRPCHKLFKEQVKNHADDIAVVAADEKLTYKELDRRADIIAAYLLKRGLKLEETVAILLPRCVDAMSAEYGVMKAGGVFLPMLPDYPNDRIDYCMKDSGSRFILTTKEIISEKKSLFEKGGFEALVVKDLISGGNTDYEEPVVLPHNLVYCIYTSGSTGKPKGVMIEHGNLCNFVNANDKNNECKNYVTLGNVCLSVASLSFDFSIMETHLPILNGKTVVIATEEEITNPLKLAKTISENKVDVIAGTPSFLSGLLDIPETVAALKHVKMYDLGAEAFPPALFKKLSSASPEAVIVNGYGPTETTISCISKVVVDPGNITIGRPAANVKAYVIDRFGNILPPYAKGELVIGGLGVGRGYVNLPEKTDEAFVTIKDKRVYRTGDIVRLNKDSELEFFGRIDNQVKLRGLRIELDEIENVMNSYPTVKQSVVTVYAPENGDAFLCGYFTADALVDIASLKNHLSESLARYMIPSAFVQMEAFPQTQNGKLDKRSLPVPERIKEKIVPPENDNQKKIFDLVAEVVGFTDFGITSDLYDIGLSSLGAIRLNVLLSKAFGVPLSINEIRENSNIRDLEKVLMVKSKENAYDIQEDYPLTQTQLGILVESLSHPGTLLYNIPILYELPLSIDEHLLKRAVESAILAHPCLNGRIFADENGEYRIKRNDETHPVVEIINVPELPEDMVTACDLLSERLYRAKIYLTDEAKYLFLDIHHIVYDGGSIEILFDDINSAYRGSNLEKEKYTGFEAALDEQRIRESDTYSKAKGYFDRLLCDADSEMLPEGDILEDTKANIASGKFTYSSSLDYSDIVSFCKDKGVTENGFMNAAFAFCLSRFSGKSSALYTTIYNGRSDSRLQRAVTMLVKTFPVFVDTRKDQNTCEYIKNVGTQLVDSMAHDCYSFAEIARDYHLSSDVLFVWQGELHRDINLGGENVKEILIPLDEAKAPIQFQVFSEKGSITVACDYYSNKYSKEYIAALAEAFEMTVNGLLSKDTLLDISLLSDRGKEILDYNNESGEAFPRKDIVTMFRETADKFPDREAVVFGDETLTYKQVDEISDRIAGFLAKKGIGKDCVVSILIERSSFMVTASLGVLKAGAAYQPLDPTYPNERLDFMVKDSGCKLLISDEKLFSKVSEYKGEVLFTKDIAALPEAEPLKRHPSPEDLFILLYTSGTTGVPKGVMLEHGNISNFCDWHRKYYGLNENSKVGAYASFGFDACMMDLYPALTTGACVCIISEEIRTDLVAMEELFKRQNITHAFMTTQVCRQFYMLSEVESLKHLYSGGEKLVPVELKDNKTAFYNGYGPTECSIFSTVKEVDKLYRRVPIGKPLSNYKCYVVDEQLKRVPPFVPGELIIAGLGVGRGYLGRPELTQKVFIKNPFSDDPDYARAYRTGDIVRLLPNGEIDFLGRNDGQVKVRGFRIELTEVESIIREYPDIKDACVDARDLGEGGKALAAYIVSDKEISVKDLKAFILKSKPPYMVPEWIMQIDRIPLNQNGKVNKRALPEPVSSELKEDMVVKAADNILEEKLKSEISRITGNEIINYQEPLEFQGLTSIGVIRLSVFVYKTFGINVPNAKFKGLSLLGLENEILSALLKGEGQISASSAATDLSAAGNKEWTPYPLSAAQLGVYMECLKNPDDKTYNIPTWLEFDNSATPLKLKNAIEKILKAHPSLDVHFETIDGQVMTVKNSNEPLDISVVEMTPKELEEYRQGYLFIFKLNKGPLYRFEIVKTEGSTWLYADFHHLIFDGYSLDLFLSDLKKALTGETVAKEEADYSTFVSFQKALLSGETRKEYDSYFAKLFEKFDSPSSITPDLPKTDLRGKSEVIRVKLCQEMVDKGCRRSGVSEAAFFLSAFYYVTARLTNSDNVFISTISAGRSDVRFSDTYGMFVNTLPIGASLISGSVDEFIKKTAADFEKAIDHENYPFAEVADKWGYTVEIMFAYQRGIVETPKIPGLKNIMDGVAEMVKFPLDVRIVDDGDNPALEIEYDDKLYSRDMIQNICRYYCTVVMRFSEDGESMLRQVSLLDEKEKEVLRSFNTVPEEKEVPDDTFFFSGMEKNAKEHPDRKAVIATDGEYTYGEFDSITDRVANALIKRGAKVGEKALILLPRTAKALFAFFGASKAGLGYIPFDPTYPTERVNLVIEDSNAQFVITTAELLPRFEGKNAVNIDELLEETDDTKPHAAIDKKNISYMIYTSGSTGRPKGVMLSHEGMAHYVADMPGKEMVNTLVKECSVYCCITTLSFDISVMEYSLALSNGITLYMANETECNNAGLLAARMMETKADCISGTPSRIYTLLNSEAFCEALRKYGRLVICGGEKYSENLMLALKKLVPHPMNIYGPSEITISCNEHDLAGDDIITIGKPTPGVTEYIVDTDGNELPIGVVGEVYIGGWGVGLGYNNLDELTREKFIEYRGQRVYKSGDYARWRSNGYMEIIGRKDNQIKLRGLRIELGEVETVLGSYDGMKHVAVKIEKINSIEHLCAWFTNKNKVDIKDLKLHLSKTLTQYMIPTAYMQLDEMPFTTNGKLDLKNLPLPEIYRGEGDGARTRGEKDFCEIFSKLLSLDNVLATENFFDLGGTSLLVTQVVIEAAKYGYSIVFGDVFANPTPRALANLFEEDTDLGKAETDKEIEDYDYSKIHDLLKKNTLESFEGGKLLELGNVLVTGATGYLGMHILHELLENTDSKVYCLIRSSGAVTAQYRLSSLMFYYFEKSYREIIGERLFVLEGDITVLESFDQLDDKNINTVFNCAAMVKHFAHDNIIEDINVGGAKNVIEFCLKNKAMMVQTSTMSIIEMGFEDMNYRDFKPTEQSLYFGQDLSNQYVHSKFLAERAVFEAAAEKGLKFKIMRYGNLAPRYSDGEFQANFETNSAMGELRAYATIGCAPFDDLDKVNEFSPIDMVAKATVELSRTPANCSVFHVITDQYIAMAHIFNEMSKAGLPIKLVDMESFEKAFDAAKRDPKKVKLMTSLMAYNQGSNDRKRVVFDMNREYTLQILYRLGFVWPITSGEYLNKFIVALEGLGYFDN